MFAPTVCIASLAKLKVEYEKETTSKSLFNSLVKCDVSPFLLELKTVHCVMVAAHYSLLHSLVLIPRSWLMYAPQLSK